MAIGVLKVFSNHTREVVCDVLVKRYIKDYGMDCLQLAVLCKCKNFVSSEIVQNNLQKIWKGTKSSQTELVFILKIKLNLTNLNFKYSLV